MESTKSGDREETGRKQVSASSPLRNASKNSFEVLRLGSASNASRIRELPSGTFMWTFIHLCIEAPPPEWHPRNFGWRNSEDTRYSTSGIRRRALRRRMSGAEHSAAGTL